MVRRFGSSLKRITMQKWKKFVVRKKCARNVSAYMGHAHEGVLLSVYFVKWKRRYGAARLHQQRKIESRQRDRVMSSKRKLDEARDRLRKLKVAVSDQSQELEEMKDELTQKTEVLNHPAQNVQLLNILIDTCRDALCTVTKLLTEDFPRMSNELQGSERESGSFLLFHQEDPHLTAYIRKSEANVRREWETVLQLWPSYFPKEKNLEVVTAAQDPRLKDGSLSYQSHIDEHQMVREFDQLRRSEGDLRSQSTEDNWDSWTEASAQALQLWVQHKLWDTHLDKPVAEYECEVAHRWKFYDWQLQAALLHRVIPPTLVQHATSDENVLLRQRRIFSEVQTLAPPMGRYISLCDPKSSPPEDHHWVHRAAVVHAYNSSATDDDADVQDNVLRDVGGQPHGIEFVREVSEPVYFAFLTELYCCHPGFTTQLTHAIDMWHRMATDMQESNAHTDQMVELAATLNGRSVKTAQDIAKLNEDMRRIAMYFITNYTQWVRERYLWYVSCTNLMQASWHNAAVLLYSRPHLGEPDVLVRPSLASKKKPRVVTKPADSIAINKVLFYDFMQKFGVTDIKERLHEYESVLKILTQHQNLLARVFAFYVALTPHGDTWSLSYASYMRMLDDCKLVGDSKRMHGLISNIFVKQVLPEHALALHFPFQLHA